MDTTWTLGVLSAGAENVQPLEGGVAATRERAVELASDALVVAAMERGRQEYRISVAGTLIIVRPGLTEQGEVDLVELAATLWRLESCRSRES